VFVERAYSTAFGAVIEVKCAYWRRVGARFEVAQLHFVQCKPALLPVLITHTHTHTHTYRRGCRPYMKLLLLLFPFIRHS